MSLVFPRSALHRSREVCGDGEPEVNSAEPAEAVVKARADVGSGVAAFNVYAGQRPFRGDARAKPLTLRAGSAVVIQGDRAAHQVANAPDRTEVAIVASDAGDSQWPALAGPLPLLKDLQVFVTKARGN